MANTLAQLLDKPKDWTLYASPLGRAQQTAHIVGDRLQLSPNHIRLDERLMELGLGEWEQQRAPDLQTQYPQISQQVLSWYLKAPGAETLAHAKLRLLSWLQDPNLPQNVLVVGHGLSGALLRGLYADMDDHAIWQQEIPQHAFLNYMVAR